MMRPSPASCRPSALLRGYTLVEMIVAVGLFSIVMMIATTAYLTMIMLDRQTRGMNDVVNNLSFSVDSMARNIRTGINYYCTPGDGTGNCWGSGGNQLSYTDTEGRLITYLIRTDAVTGKHGIGECIGTPSCTASNSTPLTDPRIEIDPSTGLKFYVRGIGRSDHVQPEVVVVIHGSILLDPHTTPTTFTIETMASQRLIDL